MFPLICSSGQLNPGNWFSRLSHERQTPTRAPSLSTQFTIPVSPSRFTLNGSRFTMEAAGSNVNRNLSIANT
jgi:hypothetical protein